ncbi:PTS mannose/fructose/sorbose/N-acetylgalactosamine transporter subunit IIC [Symbiobacterium thermophilum]|uniref:PTS system fructose/mannose-specific IIC component n=1 Tax=Symbiobacterium thermophilum (strain DSM 24528 / JCM 14929 / IAM 14863 / T) TaxID=292459 RepID=Q67N16_SYMTH|nr:PTS sugar transporter subunit IIC [Symbiobacterium thermophilum]BAD40927.1 PTS system fructose/mannose-specific IIC component [Symbiobacterium thermophilum IAM 14863]
MTYGIGIALLLGIIAYIAVVMNLGASVFWHEALIVGAVTGLIVGDVQMGLTIGATLTLMSLGMWTYGGATIPDFMTGAILGTAFGALPGVGVEGGLAIAVPAALLMTQLDVLGRATTTLFIHGADKAVAEGNVRAVTWWHLLGQLPWGLTRFFPVFLAVWLGAEPVQNFINWMPDHVMNAMRVTGAVLPALGFALLLTMMPLKKYWPFALLGYVLFAYLKVPMIGIALTAVAVGILYLNLKEVRARG